MQRARLLGGLGLVGSLFWLALGTVLAPDWGPPGSRNYLSYETINRLWGPCFVAMLAGFVGLFLRFPLEGQLAGTAKATIVGGLLAMLAGNVGEFWFFTNQPYGQINPRNLSWMLVLLGLLCLLIGCLLLGLTARRQRVWPLAVSLVFMLALPATNLLIVVDAISLMFTPVIVVSVLAGGLALAPAPAHHPTTGRSPYLKETKWRLL